MTLPLSPVLLAVLAQAPAAPAPEAMRVAIQAPSARLLTAEASAVGGSSAPEEENPGARVGALIVGSTLGGFLMGTVAYIGTLAVYGFPSSDYQGVIVYAGIAPAVALPAAMFGFALGGYLGGGLAGGRGTFFSVLLGSVVGGALAGIITATAISITSGAWPVVFFAAALPVIGTWIGYEWSHGQNVRRHGAVPAAVVPILRPEHKGVAVAWQF